MSGTVPIRIGDPANSCSFNTTLGVVNTPNVTLTSNLAVTFGGNSIAGNVTANTNGPGNTVIKANTIFGALACTGNNPPPPTPANPTTTSTRSSRASA